MPFLYQPYSSFLYLNLTFPYLCSSLLPLCSFSRFKNGFCIVRSDSLPYHFFMTLSFQLYLYRYVILLYRMALCYFSTPFVSLLYQLDSTFLYLSLLLLTFVSVSAFLFLLFLLFTYAFSITFQLPSYPYFINLFLHFYSYPYFFILLCHSFLSFCSYSYFMVWPLYYFSTPSLSLLYQLYSSPLYQSLLFILSYF